MTLPAHAKTSITPKEYYEIELTAVERSDFYAGEMYAMAGGTTEHATIGANLQGILYNELKGKACRPFNQDQRIKAESNDLRIYPDASVFCEPLIYDEEDSHKHTAVNPTALFEVLSESTEAYDRGFKFDSFRQTESLQVYVLISQQFPLVEVFTRAENGDLWILSHYRGIDTCVDISQIGVTLHLADLYDRVEFQPYVLPEER